MVRKVQKKPVKDKMKLEPEEEFPFDEISAGNNQKDEHHRRQNYGSL